MAARAAPDLANAALALSSSTVECQETTITASSEADAWISENDNSNKGSDAVLNVAANPSSGNSRALVRFGLPNGVPEGCVVASAMLRLYTTESSEGSRVEALRLASGWSESSVTWSTQPGTIGIASTIWSRQGYMQWRVAAQVQEMLEGGNHGFLIRDAAEGTIEGGGGHGFYGREKGESPPQLVIRFAAPASEEPPGPPEPPVPAALSCGQVLTRSTQLTNDLSGCPGDGLVIGADRIIVDLGGHTIDGVGLGTGILNDGYTTVTVRNGTVQQFDYGVELLPETKLNVVERLTLQLNELAAIELFDAEGNEIRENTISNNGDGIALLSGTRGSVVADNTITLNSGAGLLVVDSNANRLERNSVSGGGDLGIGLERASNNTLLGNTVSSNSDGGIEIRHGSNANRVESNEVSESGDTGIMVDESDRNELISNTTRLMSDSGITLNSANDGIVRGNDLRFNPGGLEMGGSSRNVIDSNDTSHASGNGIELGGGSYDNVVTLNMANTNDANGIYIADEALTEPGNLLYGNTASGNRADGIAVAKGGHTITANVTRNNGGWGINATGENQDGLGNVATGNGQAQQCSGVVCKEEWIPPDTAIGDRPGDPRNSTSASFTLGGSDDTTPASALRFQCRLDSEDDADFVACSSPRVHAGLSPGSHTFDVRAIDLALNVDPTPARYTWTVDITAPKTTIDSGPDAITSSTSATFALSADEPGSTFECSLDGAPFAPCASPVAHAELVPGTHEFRVRAIDRAQNADPTPAQYTWTVDTTPPHTTVESGPNAQTSSRSAGFSFSADEPGSTFECALDGVPVEPCISPAEYSGLAEGAHEFQVRATDRAGNVDPSPAAYAWTIDLTPPETTIEAGPADPTNETSAGFRFGADEEGASFACSLDGGAFVGCSSPVDYAGLGAGPHTFRVQATDRAGNLEPEPDVYAWTIDLTPPETTIEAGPADPTRSNSASFVFSADEENSTFECRLDAGGWEPCSSPKAYSDLADGVHSFAVRASDRAANSRASSAVHVWTVDTVAPQTRIDAHPRNPSNGDSPSFAFSSSEQGSSFECRLGEGEWVSCSSPQAYGPLADGAYRFQVRATDRAGNTDAVAAGYDWTVDTPAPETTVQSGPADPTQSASASFVFSAGEEGSTFECRLDAGEWAACSSPQGYGGLADGEHRFEVRATDPAGNTDASPAGRTWTVDTVAPQTTIGSGPSGPTRNENASFRFSADEAGATFQCRLDAGAWTGCSSPQGYTALADGAHSFEVRATDLAGNTDTSPAVRTWTVDTARPQTRIGSGPVDPTRSTAASFTFLAGEDSSFQCRLDAGEWASCSSAQEYSALAEGAHTFEVRATDAASNVDTSPAVHTWTVDTLAPETTVDSGPLDPSDVRVAEFEFSSTESGSSFECRLDGGAWAPCTSPQAYSELADGAHTFEVRATDRAGNVDPEPAVYGWTVEEPHTMPPDTTVTAAPPALTSSRSASFSFTASETGSSFECSLDNAAFVACESPQTHAGLAAGVAQLPRARDRRGRQRR